MPRPCHLWTKDDLNVWYERRFGFKANQTGQRVKWLRGKENDQFEGRVVSVRDNRPVICGLNKRGKKICRWAWEKSDYKFL